MLLITFKLYLKVNILLILSVLFVNISIEISNKFDEESKNFEKKIEIF